MPADKLGEGTTVEELAFYKHYGFIVAEEEKKEDTPWKTPMWYPLSMQRGMKTERRT